jgi:hypothetical protein
MLVAGLIPRWSAHAPDVTLERVLIAIVSFGLERDEFRLDNLSC